MPTQTEPPAVIRISTNTILDGKFYIAGAPLPVERAEDLPENLRPLVVTDEPEAEEAGENADQPRGSFELNTPYHLTDDGRLGRRAQRQIAQMEAEAEEEAYFEEQMDAPLPPEVVESLQRSHEDAIGLQTAQAAAEAERVDQIADAVIADQEPPKLFVKRGGRHYAPADKARLQPDEPVFVKDPTDGTFQFIGSTDSKGELPDLPITMP